MNDLWQYSFNGVLENNIYWCVVMTIDPRDYNILTSDPVLNPKENVEKTIENIFETFSFNATHVVMQPMLTLVASGRNSGMALDIGDGVCQIAAFHYGYPLPTSSLRLTLTGELLTDLTLKLLIERGYPSASSHTRGVARTSKEKFEVRIPESEPGNLRIQHPDLINTKLTSSECTTVTETLFNPSSNQLEGPGIQEALCQSIQNAPIDLRRELWSDITLSGGTCQFKNFRERLQAELANSLKRNKNDLRSLRTDHAYQPDAVWNGGSIIASLSSLWRTNSWVHKEMYEEVGLSVINAFPIMTSH